MAHIKIELDLVPMEEQLPPEDGSYVVLDGSNHELNVAAWRGDQWVDPATDKEWISGGITHWAEIPTEKFAVMLFGGGR